MDVPSEVLVKCQERFVLLKRISLARILRINEWKEILRCAIQRHWSFSWVAVSLWERGDEKSLSVCLSANTQLLRDLSDGVRFFTVSLLATTAILSREWWEYRKTVLVR